MDLKEAERQLDASADHRVLRRIPPVTQWAFPVAGETTRRALFIDVETTGLSLETDEVIELALLPFEYDPRAGVVTAVFESAAFTGFRQPGFPIPDSSTRIHGISDKDVAGATIDAVHVERLVRDAQLIVAHNAAFDRPMVEKHWPVFSHRSWACSLNDVSWRDEGFGAGKLDYILTSLGWFYDSHRALADALAGAFLLTRTLPVSNRSVLAALLESARRPLKAVRAEGAAFEKRDALRQRGYRWDTGDGDRRAKAWWIMTPDPDAEIAWLNREIYASPRAPPVVDMPATLRYSGRIWDTDIGA
ncbi:MAG: DNA polymerase III subunit epsilon [Alphaproteobacteria bacterium]|nr:MAG: DNA polymerase III subunit epsilon [Caulobacteraceae bacterium]TPW06633.1 MAG: DNA polymerase III subunit epsilon [Alphaproteobacteria bacterium]